jgi:hypothetical protein
MAFFNKKEDVMRIELTTHGKHLLSKGEFKPEYYAFFDDDILYESEAVSMTENNTETKIRIISNTPSLKPPAVIKGIEENLFNKNRIEDDNTLLNIIGTNKTTSENANGWNVTAIMGEFSSSMSYISSSVSPIYNVPQVECEMNFTMSVGNATKDDYFSLDYESSEVATDNSFLKVKRDDMLLYILEKNGFIYKDALSVEVFKFDDSEKYMNKMSFFQVEEKIQGIVVENDDGTVVANEGETVIDSGIFVDTYFELLTDRQIPNDELCRGIVKLKDKNIFLGLNIECDDLTYGEINIYRTSVTDADIEDCE